MIGITVITQYVPAIVGTYLPLFVTSPLSLIFPKPKALKLAQAAPPSHSNESAIGCILSWGADCTPSWNNQCTK